MTRTPKGYTISAVPVSFGSTGSRTFFSDQSLVIRENYGQGAATLNSQEVGSAAAKAQGQPTERSIEETQTGGSGSQPTTPRPNTASSVDERPLGAPRAAVVPPAIRELLERWRTSVLQHDLDAQMSCYAPVVEVFFTKSNVQQSEIRKDKEAVFTAYPDVRVYTISELAVAPLDSDRARATFRKEWDARGSRQFAGAEREQLTLQRSDGAWKIVGEQEVQIFWVRKDRPSPK